MGTELTSATVPLRTRSPNCIQPDSSTSRPNCDFDLPDAPSAASRSVSDGSDDGQANAIRAFLAELHILDLHLERMVKQSDFHLHSRSCSFTQCRPNLCERHCAGLA